MSHLKQFLAAHQIDPLRLSAVAGVRYLTVWNALNEKPITQDHAVKIGVALRSLTGISFPGTLAIIQPLEDQSTIPMRRFSKEKGEKY